MTRTTIAYFNTAQEGAEVIYDIHKQYLLEKKRSLNVDLLLSTDTRIRTPSDRIYSLVASHKDDVSYDDEISWVANFVEGLVAETV